MDDPRGVRLNNPGNIKYTTTDKWQGLASPDNDGTFFVFEDPIYGIRAMARTLIAYQDKNNCKTVRDSITRWSATDQEAYVAFVASYMEVTPTAEINVHEYSTLRPMIEAIIQQENGAIWSKYYTSDQLDKALVLAGIEPDKKPLVTSTQMVGGAVAASATVAPAIIDQINQAQTTLSPLAGTSHIFSYLLAALALGGIGISMYSKYNERQKGIS